jgi:predicted nucleic acid-binding protein
VIVVDTNLIIYITIPGDRTAQAEKVLAADPGWAAPLLWRSEFRNVLMLHMRTGKMDVNAAVELAKDAEARMEDQEHVVDSEAVLRLAASSRCSAYDCEFVALAQKLKVKLVTSDRQILAAFPETAVSLDSF